VRATTVGIYRHALKHHVEPRIGGVRLSRIQPVHVLDWLTTMERAGVKPRARQIAFDVLRRCLTFGVRAGLLSRSLAEGIQRPRAPKPEVRSLTAEQAKALLAEARKGPAWVEAAVALGLCGLRRGETFGLTWRDVGADKLRVRQSLFETMDNTRGIGELKSKSARREIPLPPFARAALARHRKALGAIPHPTTLVFQTAAGTPVHFANFGRSHFRGLVKRAGVPGTSFHQLRHTAATLLLASGVDVKTAQTVLGHAKASHTLDLYADSVPGNVSAAMERLGEMI
jgi:integrase